jgi:xanthine dehydrogenase accessory factor
MIEAECSPVLVRGVGDVGSAVAVVLFRDGYAVALHDEPAPAAPRRGMAFADAVFDGAAILDDLSALRVDTSAELRDALAAREVVPVTIVPFSEVLKAAAWSAVIDARMRKRAVPEDQCGMAPLTIGLGPNFVAGETVDLAIETMWGEQLGAIIKAGPTLPFAGEPRAIGGVGRARFVYAPAAGRFETSVRIGDRVEENAVVASIGCVALRAPIGGVLRGLTRNGVEVAIRTKVVEVDPRGEPAAAFGLGERPRRIAEGVLKALARARVLEPPCEVGLSRRTLLRATAALAAAVPTVNFGVSAAELDIPNVAAAADLNYALKEIADGFAKATGRQVKLTFGSSGNFATQIRNGAPFQVFLCADEEYVQALAKEGRTDGNGTLYAIAASDCSLPRARRCKSTASSRGWPMLSKAARSQNSPSQTRSMRHTDARPRPPCGTPVYGMSCGRS